MSLALTTTWNPRGEFARLARLYPVLSEVYDWIVISLPPHTDPQMPAALHDLGPYVRAFINREWPQGRYMALRTALETPVRYLQYADMDRLLRWIELRPEEWRVTAERIRRSDCLVIGRTEQAYATHPRSLVETEAISNRTVSHLLGSERVLDVSAGSRGFSRQAAAFLVDHASRDRALGADAEWLVLLRRAGFEIDYCQVDGLDWESADRYRENAADGESQRKAAEAYDREAQNWQVRVSIALEIVQSGLDAVRREIEIPQ